MDSSDTDRLITGRQRWRRALALAGLYAGTALIVMEANIVNIAISAIRAQLYAGVDIGLWVIDVYTLTFAALLLTAGRIGDRIGLRRAYHVGLAVLGVASIGWALRGGWWPPALCREPGRRGSRLHR